MDQNVGQVVLHFRHGDKLPQYGVCLEPQKYPKHPWEKWNSLFGKGGVIEKVYKANEKIVGSIAYGGLRGLGLPYWETFEEFQRLLKSYQHMIDVYHNLVQRITDGINPANVHQLMCLLYNFGKTILSNAPQGLKSSLITNFKLTQTNRKHYPHLIMLLGVKATNLLLKNGYNYQASSEMSKIISVALSNRLILGELICPFTLPSIVYTPMV